MKCLSWLLVFLILVSSSYSYIIDEWSDNEIKDGVGLYTSTLNPRYYNNGSWQKIDRGIRFYDGYFRPKDYPRDIRLNYRSLHATLDIDGFRPVPVRIGAVIDGNEVTYRVRNNVVGETHGDTLRYSGFFGTDTTLEYRFFGSSVDKLITIHSKPEGVPELDSSCNDTAFIDYELDSSYVYVADGSIWDEIGTISVRGKITVLDTESREIGKISRSWLIRNNTHYELLDSELLRSGNKLILRTSFPLGYLGEESSYPLKIDPVIEVLEESWYLSSEDYNIQCTPSGFPTPCCSFPYSGTCSGITTLTPDCNQGFVGGGYYPLVEWQRYCGACAIGFNCCRPQGSLKLMMLWQMNWTDMFNYDYNQVNILNATVYLNLTNPSNTVEVQHHDTEEGSSNIPYCDTLPVTRWVHDDCPYPDLSPQTAYSITTFDLKNHVQHEIHDGHDYFWLFMHSDTNFNVNNNQVEEGNITIEYELNDCRPPFTGDWFAPCNCTLNETFTVHGNLTINGTGDEFFMYDMIFSKPDSWINIEPSCEVIVPEDISIS